MSRIDAIFQSVELEMHWKDSENVMLLVHEISKMLSELH